MKRSKTINIAVAEDNKSNQRIISFLLKRLGYELNIFDNGAVLIEQLKENDYDLVLMDLQMPIMDGLEATRGIRAGAAGEKNKFIKILALTANVESFSRDDCLGAGMDGYLTKPVIPRALDQKIQELFISAVSEQVV